MVRVDFGMVRFGQKLFFYFFWAGHGRENNNYDAELIDTPADSYYICTELLRLRQFFLVWDNLMGRGCCCENFAM